MAKEAINRFGYAILQVLRVCTVATLLAAGAACWVLTIFVDKEQTFYPFECVSLVFTFFMAMIFIVAEYPMHKHIRNYLRQHWPVLSDGYGIGWLGGGIIVIGAHLLGELNKPDKVLDKFNVHCRDLVEAAGILCLIFGSFNVACSLIFRSGKDGLTSRDIRRNNSLASGREELPSTYAGSPTSSVHNEKISRLSFWKKSAPKEDAAGKTTFPSISGPIYTHQTERNPPPTYAPSSPEPSHYEPKESPVMPGAMRPRTADHPMLSGGLQAPAPALRPHHTGTSSIYSSDNRRQYTDRYSAVSYNHF